MTFPYRYPEDDPIDDGPFDRSTYSGAPDECNIHWPTKYDAKGDCPTCKSQEQMCEQWALDEQRSESCAMHTRKEATA